MPPVPPVLHSLPGTSGSGSRTADRPTGDATDPARRVSSGLVYFAHLARLALPEADLDAPAVESLRRDLAVLASEATRARLRPALVHALLDAVLDDLLPALPAPARVELVTARPTLAHPSHPAS